MGCTVCDSYSAVGGNCITMQNKSKKILLTGSTGFIGRHVLEELNTRNYEIHCLVFGDSPHLRQPNIYSHNINFLDFENLESKLENLFQEIKMEQCIHLAWFTAHKDYLTSSINRDWLKASKILAQVFYNSGGKRMVAAGTCIEYDLSKGEICREDETPVKPDTLYAQCKVELQQYLEQLTQKSQNSYAWGRIFFVYGPHDRPQRLIPYIIRQLLNNQPAKPRFGALKRDFVLVSDVARQFVDLLETTFEGCVNFGSGEISRIQDIFDNVGEIMKKQELIIKNDAPTNTGSEHVLIASDPSKFRNHVYSRSFTSLKEGLANTVNWFLEH